MIINLDLVFEALCRTCCFLPIQAHLQGSENLFLNTYHKVMQVQVFLEFTSMKSRIYSCISLKYTAAITWVSKLGDTREFKQDLLVKGTKLLHMYYDHNSSNTIPLWKRLRKNQVIYWHFQSQESVRGEKRVHDLWKESQIWEEQSY